MALTTVEERYCSAEFTQGIHGELIFLSVVNICLSISAVLGNTLILVALNKETSLHQASKLLYSTLAITELGVAIIVEPLPTFSCDLLDFCRERKMEHLLLYTFRERYFCLCFVFSILLYTDCNKFRQTSRIDTGA